MYLQVRVFIIVYVGKLMAKPKSRSLNAKRRQRRRQKQAKRATKLSKHEQMQKVIGNEQDSLTEDQINTETDNTIGSTSTSVNSSSCEPSEVSKKMCSTPSRIDSSNNLIESSVRDQNLPQMQADFIRMKAAEDVKEVFHRVSNLSTSKKCAKLEAIILEKTETLHFHTHKIQKQKEEITKLKEECRQRINSVRGFWQDRIFNEHSRAGKIIKKACKRQI